MFAKFALTKRLREIYAENGNLMAFLRQQGASTANSIEDILIAYDFQAGSYIAAYEKSPDYLDRYTRELAAVMLRLGPFNSALEAGVGEATTLSVLARSLGGSVNWQGFDVSWSRVRLGRDFSRRMQVQADLFCGDLFNIPLEDGSVEIVYTSHSLEPNGGHEREAIRELARVASRWLILLEPAYELASPEARARMDKHGYVRGLPDAIREEGLELVEHRIFPVCVNPLNPTGLYVVRVPVGKRGGGYRCPISKTPLEADANVYFSPAGMLAYPVIDGVPCLLPANAILATKYGQLNRR